MSSHRYQYVFSPYLRISPRRCCYFHISVSYGYSISLTTKYVRSGHRYRYHSNLSRSVEFFLNIGFAEDTSDRIASRLRCCALVRADQLSMPSAAGNDTISAKYIRASQMYCDNSLTCPVLLLAQLTESQFNTTAPCYLC